MSTDGQSSQIEDSHDSVPTPTTDSSSPTSTGIGSSQLGAGGGATGSGVQRKSIADTVKGVLASLDPVAKTVGKGTNLVLAG